MKYRESGMPEQAYWETLFDIEGILDSFAIGPKTGAADRLASNGRRNTVVAAHRIGYRPKHPTRTDRRW